MVSNRRRGGEPIPANYAELLTPDQSDALRKLESFGWSLKKIRRPKFEPIEVILVHSDGKSYAILLESGELDQKTPVAMRSEREETQLDASEALTTVAQQTFTEGEKVPPPPPATAPASPMAEPVPSSTNDALPDSADKPPPKYLV